MDFQQLADVAEKWCSCTPFELIAAEETERRMDFYADPGVSFYVLCPDNGSGDSFRKNLHNPAQKDQDQELRTCGVRARTACPSCSSHRITSLPAARRRSMKSWKKSSSPSDLCWGFQMKTTPLKSTVRMWRRSQRRTTPRWGSVSNKLLGRLPEGE